jgi:hypothetical protein
MNILVWAAEHSVLISIVAAIVAVPLKFERWLPRKIKKYLLIADVFIVIATPLLGILKEKLDEQWKLQTAKQSGIHTREITALKQANKELEKQVLDDSKKLKSAIRPIVNIDASLSDKVVLLPASGTRKYLKSDSSANKVIIKPSVPGQVVPGGSSYELSLQGETVTLELSGNIWFRIQ